MKAVQAPDVAPDVSVVMANWNGAEHLPAAAASVLGQEGATVELLIADDGSTDASPEVIGRLAAVDGRVRPVPGASRGGPAAARNRALAEARGRWIAIVDADDLIAPARLARLAAAAEAAGADAAADDLAYFGATSTAGGTLLGSRGGGAPFELSTAEFLRGHVARYRRPAWGYLKPVFRRAALDGLRYDETLLIGEDSDLLLRFLLRGRRLVVVPEALYRYRRHAGSISHRWSPAILGAMTAHQRALLGARPDLAPDVRRLMEERLGGLERRLAFEEMLVALRGGAALRAAAALARRPTLLWPLGGAVVEGLSRRATALLGGAAR